MKNGKCPMCNSTKVYANPEAELRAGEAAEIRDIDNELDVYLVPYVCVNCGFVALFVADMDDVKELPDKDGWERIG